MLSRLSIRTLLVVAVALLVGFGGAFVVLDLAAELAPADLLIQIGAAYLTWVALALVGYVLIRRFVPVARDRGRAGHPSDAARTGGDAIEPTPRDDGPSHRAGDAP